MKWKLAACRINKGLKQKDVAELMHTSNFGSSGYSQSASLLAHNQITAPQFIWLKRGS